MSDQDTKPQRGQLTFSLQLRSGVPSGWGGVPIEVRKRSLALAARCLSSDSLELEPGAYHVTAQMPAGQVLSGSVEVTPGQQQQVVLRPEEQDESPYETQAHHHFVVEARMSRVTQEKARAPRYPMLESMGPATASQASTVLRGLILGRNTSSQWNLLAPEPWAPAEWRPLPLEPDVAQEGYVVLSAPAHRYGPSVIQLHLAGAPLIHMVFPAAPEPFGGHRITVTRSIDGALSMDLQLKNPNADMLLRYSQHGDRTQTLLSERILMAEQLLFGKHQDPLGAAVGAYALMRFSEAKKIPTWTENLFEGFTWLPDGSAIRGEHLARVGEHGKACQAFLTLAERGLPIFSDGLTFAVDRLRSYVKTHWTRRKDAPTPEEQERVAKLLPVLARYAAYTDFTRPVTTFTGADPSHPSLELPKSAWESRASDVDLTPNFPMGTKQGPELQPPLIEG